MEKTNMIYENQFGVFELKNNEFKNIETGEKFHFDFNVGNNGVRYYPEGGSQGTGFSVAYPLIF